MVLYKRLGDALNFLYQNPIVFILYLPIALLGLIQPSYESNLLAIRTVLVMALLLLFSAFVLALSILGAYNHEHKKPFNFNSLSKLSLQRFTKLLIVQLILFIGISLFSVIMDWLSAIFTSNLGQAFTIVFSIAFFCILIKLILSIPSTVISGEPGFKESWQLVGQKEFVDLALILVGYSILAYVISLLPFASNVNSFISYLLLSPILVILLTFLYLDYTKKSKR